MAEGIAGAAFIPGLPHLLAADPAPSWTGLADAVRAVGDDLRAAGAEALMIVSTQWISVLGLQVQTRPVLEGRRVDENWYAYDFGTLDFRIETDVALADAWLTALREGGFQARPTDHPHFPVDTGLLVATRLLDPDGLWPVAQVSLNLYGTAESVERLGAAAAIAAGRTGRKVALVAISALSSHPHRRWITPGEDCLASERDDDWNRRILDLLADGRAAEALDLREAYAREAAVDSGLRALSFLKGAVDIHVPAAVHAYGPVWGLGAAVITWSGKGGVS